MRATEWWELGTQFPLCSDPWVEVSLSRFRQSSLRSLAFLLPKRTGAVLLVF
jgi:hypothetical protein